MMFMGCMVTRLCEILLLFIVAYRVPRIAHRAGGVRSCVVGVSLRRCLVTGVEKGLRYLILYRTKARVINFNAQFLDVYLIPIFHNSTSRANKYHQATRDFPFRR